MELAAQRQDVGFAVTTFPISERRACELLGVWRSSCRYKAKPDHDSELRTQLMELAGERPRFGYRRLGVLLVRKGQIVNHKRLFRVYHGAGLSVKRIRRKKLVRVGVPQPVLAHPNEEWSLDFVCDAVADGRSISVLSVVDNFTRECLALETDTSFGSQRVTRVLDGVIARRGSPKALRMDNGLNASEKFRMSAGEVRSTQGNANCRRDGLQESRVPEMVFHEFRDRAHHNEQKICAGAQS
jgi:putative transposase